MGVLGLAALIVNFSVAGLLYKYREGDSNMQSVWLCTRNDAIGNVAVMIAAIGVYFTSTLWPDLIVATGMGTLSMYSSWLVIKKACSEMYV